MDNNTPNHVVGNDLTVEGSVYASHAVDAELIYTHSCKRLLDVNAWHTLTDMLVNRFQLTDAAGTKIYRLAEEGDYIQIDAPVPGTVAGDGYDWVKIERIESISSYDISSLSIRVRPVPNPLHPEEGVAHFFDEAATSTFEIVRNGLFVKAAVYGRNEVANVAASNVIDKVRNSLVAAGAIGGMARKQWEALVKGLLYLPKD